MRKLSKTEYNTIHQWRLRHYKKTGVCEGCDTTTRTQWSNKSGNYIRDDENDWQELCIPCHANYDTKHFGRGRLNIKKPILIYNYYWHELLRLREYVWFSD